MTWPTGSSPGKNLAANAWHKLTLYGTLKNGRIYYTTFVSDGVTFPINEDFPAVSESYSATALVVATQVDDNFFGKIESPVVSVCPR